MTRKRRLRAAFCGEPSSQGADSGLGRAAGDRFALRARIGAGGMCEVFTAVDLRRVESGDVRPVVALKRLLPELVHRRQAQAALAREYLTLCRLTHPGIVRVFDLHRERWGMCFSMELLKGAPAHVVLGGRPDGLGAECLAAAAAVFESLAYVHSRGVAHGDVKPANVHLGRSGRVVLLDFNAARTLSRPGTAGAGEGGKLAGRDGLAGLSPLHAAPEILAGAPFTPAGDVFAASCTVYEMLTGQHPFRMLSAREAEACGLRPQRPSSLGRGRWAALRRGLAFDPAARPTAARLCAVFGEAGWPERLRRVLRGTGAGR